VLVEPGGWAELSLAERRYRAVLAVIEDGLSVTVCESAEIIRGENAAAG
jgi:hypothetical protein